MLLPLPDSRDASVDGGATQRGDASVIDGSVPSDDGAVGSGAGGTRDAAASDASPHDAAASDPDASAAPDAGAGGACGDGVVRTGVEACDDGNTSNTDACLNTCVAARCGDTFVRAGVEVCDDGNTVGGDGCSSTCTGAPALAWTSQSDGYCLKLETGQVKCWGSNAAGRCGLGNTVNRGDDPNEMGSNLPFVNLGTGRTAVDVQTGYFTRALLDNGTVKCWGINDRGQLGQATPTRSAMMPTR